MRILGIDPGLRKTGIGCLDSFGPSLKFIHADTIFLSKNEESVSERLYLLHLSLEKIILELKPHCIVVEKIFFAKNAVSALKLGQARGIALLSGKMQNLPVFEYSVTEVKQSVVGFGRASKDQVSLNLARMIPGTNFKTDDASDALALAFCHSIRIRSRMHPPIET